MHISWTRYNETTVVKLRGRLENPQRRLLRKYIEKSITEETKYLNLNFQAVSYIDSMIIGQLVLMKMWLQGKDIQLSLSNVHGAVKQVLDLLKFSRVIPTYKDEQIVIAALR